MAGFFTLRVFARNLAHASTPQRSMGSMGVLQSTHFVVCMNADLNYLLAQLLGNRDLF